MNSPPAEVALCSACDGPAVYRQRERCWVCAACGSVTGTRPRQDWRPHAGRDTVRWEVRQAMVIGYLASIFIAAAALAWALGEIGL